MSITVTLDDDVVAKVKAESEARGVSVDGAVNELLRSALATRLPVGERKRFTIEPFRGSGPPLLNIDCTARLLEELDGPDHR
jgi:hypothetical protein